MATFNESINSTTLDTSFGEYTFTLSTPYVLQVGDRIMIEYGGPQGIEIEVWNSDKFDGANTRRVRYTTAYSFSNTVDVTGRFIYELKPKYSSPKNYLFNLFIFDYFLKYFSLMQYYFVDN